MIVRRRRLAVALACAAASAMACEPAAQAKPKLAVDADAAISTSTGVDSGGGAAVRFGYEIPLVLVFVTPEIGGSYHFFGGDEAPGASRFFAGGRFGVGQIVRPGVYAHAGYGHVAFGNGSFRSGATYDAGVFLDFTLLPVLDLGIHGAYTSITASSGKPENDWFVAGVHAALVF
jgi:catechol 2,3-dioxygenase-like lactoylglutathione lyase family enzyme